jgi:hypothetical protein
MAHFAQLNKVNNIIDVRVVDDSIITDADNVEQESLGIAFLASINNGGWWKQTSYNGTFRNNFAKIGDTYDDGRDAFIPPQPFPSWVLVEDTCQWEAPTAIPDDGEMYNWNEDTTAWVEVA